MPRLLPSKPIHWILLIILIPVLSLGLAVSGIFPYSTLNCWTEDVDLATGRTRYRRYILTYLTSEQVQDSWLTESLDPDQINRVRPKWRRASTYSPFRAASPDHTYNGSIEQLAALEQINELITFEPDAQRATAKRILGMWRASGSTKRAQIYVELLAKTAEQLATTPGASITTTDLP